MNIIIDRLNEILTASPNPILSSDRVSAKKPSNINDIPAIVISMIIENRKGSGIGHLVRSGDTVVKSSGVIEVGSNAGAFSSNLKSLRLWPLPLRKNPSSVERDFTENDIRVRNVTDSAHPFDYKMVDDPTKGDEYLLDTQNGMIIFGEPQVEGEKLEIIHWTVTWRNEVLGERYKGSIALEIWSSSPDKTAEISQELQTKIVSDRVLLRKKGFLRFEPESLEPLENIELNSPVGSSFSVWRQKLGYRFVFEIEEGGELTSGTVIKRIDIDVNKNLSESFKVPK